ncbi:copper fist DNA binding domain-containing protein [Aspergillus coremiiformis]|uniref:Copper fist DNA binding domain-containing protein n=1 Tax=Aspergillus coremiiformis TaxID=138285 RepID=A0A5N6ZEE9_9EURO|nr:copper fist DNA binding domain-containing protein [Aspergillus coremiiformis]
MLVDGVKWACGPCVRGHRVSTCEHHDRPLIRIKRKGRPFSTCHICKKAPCSTPRKHYKLKKTSKIREIKSSPENPIASRVSSRSTHPCLPLAPRPTETSAISPTMLPPFKIKDGERAHAPRPPDAPLGMDNRLSTVVDHPPRQQPVPVERNWESCISPKPSFFHVCGKYPPPELGAGEPTRTSPVPNLPPPRTLFRRSGTLCSR